MNVSDVEIVQLSKVVRAA